MLLKVTARILLLLALGGDALAGEAVRPADGLRLSGAMMRLAQADVSAAGQIEDDVPDPVNAEEVSENPAGRPALHPDKRLPTLAPKAAGESSQNALGKERARLLRELNQSLTVSLPPAVSLSQLETGAEQVDKLTMFESVALALGYSNEVAASTAKRDTSEWYAAAALGPLLPRVDYRYNGGREYSNPSSITDNSNNRVPYSMHRRTDNQLFVRQALVDLPSFFERLRQNLLVKSAEATLNGTQERVAYETLASYLKLIQLRLAVVLAEGYEVELKKLLRYVTDRAEAGGSTQADMQRVRGRVINASSLVIEARGAYESGLVEFKRLTGVVPLSLAIPASLLPNLPADFDEAMAIATQNNHELQAARKDVESVVHERRAMIGRYLPKLEVELSSSRTYNSGGVAETPPSPGKTVFDVQDDQRAMLVMNWNLLNGGSDLMQSQALDSKRREYEYRANEIQRRMEESLRVNFNALSAINGRIDAVQQEVESNQEVVAAFNEQLFAANRSLLDVLDAYQRLYNSRVDLSRLVISEATAGLQMLRNIGQLQGGIASLE